MASSANSDSASDIVSGDEFENGVLDQVLEEMDLAPRDLTCFKCSTSSDKISTMQKIYRPSSGHGRATTDKTIYLNPAVSWICIFCESEYSRWCDQPKNKKKYKPGCSKHKLAPCLWIDINFGKQKNTPHWILYCLICKAAGIKHNQSMPPGAVRGRCPNCLVSLFAIMYFCCLF